MKQSHKKTLQVLFGFLVSFGLIVWMAREVSWNLVWEEMKKTRYSIFIPATIVLMTHFVLRAYRWKFLLPEGERVKLRPLFDAFMIGNFANFFLPLRAGEFIRPYVLTLYTPYTYSTVLSSVVIERFFDLAMVLLSFAGVAALVSGFPAWVYQGAWGLSTIAGGLLIFIICGALIPEPLLKLVRWFTNILPQKFGQIIFRIVSEFVSGAKVIRNPVALLKVLGLSAAVWLSSHFVFYIYLFLFPSIEPSLLLAVTIAVIIALAVAAPSAPGFIGVYQTACVGAFALFGVDSDRAMAYAIVSHIFQYAIVAGVGIFVLLRNNLKLSDLSSRGK